MKVHAVFCLTLALLATALSLAGDDAVAKDLKALAGTWRVVSFERDGKKLPPEALEKLRSIYTPDGKAKVLSDGKTIVEVTLKLDPAKTPKQSDSYYSEGELKGKTVFAIYEISGDDLKVCYSFPGKPRPTEFSSKEGSGQVNIAYKREKK